MLILLTHTHILIQRMMETRACGQPEPLYIIAVRTTNTEWHVGIGQPSTLTQVNYTLWTPGDTVKYSVITVNCHNYNLQQQLEGSHVVDIWSHRLDQYI